MFYFLKGVNMSAGYVIAQLKVTNPENYKEYVEKVPNVYPTGFGIPEYQIRPFDIPKKDQQYQKTAPDNSLFQTVNDLGGGFSHHKFTKD